MTTPTEQLIPISQIDEAELETLIAYWETANYLTIAQIYLKENALLQEPLTAEHIKPRLLGHWGTSPGQSLIYLQLNRLIRMYDVDLLYIAGPGHGGPAIIANVYMEGTYAEFYPHISESSEGLNRLVRQFSTPGGIPSHVSVPTPGSIHEGGELGYALVHAFGAVFDHPDLIAACVIGDGEAETGPLSGSWKGIRFLNPARDGAVLPILHLNGYKISGPTVFGRTPDPKIIEELSGHGYEVELVSGDDPKTVHRAFAAALERSYAKIRNIQEYARAHGVDNVPTWPAIVLRTPKGWTGPKVVDGLQIEGTFRAHQVPISDPKTNPAHLIALEQWLRSYRPELRFDRTGRLIPELRALAPSGTKRMGSNPVANGGLLRKPLDIPPFTDYALPVTKNGTSFAESTRQLGDMLRDLYDRNPNSFRLFCPDETNSNRLGAVFERQNRCLVGGVTDTDDHVQADGRVMEVLSEHLCEGWLEGYLLTGRHGLFATYEAFAMVSASMAIQHAKWLEHADTIPWRAPVASLNVLLTSTCWRNDHNGFSHQGPGLIDTLLAMSGAVVRVYLPPDANCLLSVAHHCFTSTNYVNLIVIDKQPQLQWLDMDDAIAHCARGVSIWDWASNEPGDPDIVLGCAGDVPTLETIAAAALLRERLPDLHVRVVNVVDLMKLVHPNEHPHGMANDAFDALFTEKTDVIFSFHGYARAMHQIIHGRSHSDRFHVHGFNEQGTTTTPFDMVVLNEMSRYHLVLNALRRSKRTLEGSHETAAYCREMLTRHHSYIAEHLEDMPEIRDWVWPHA